MSLEHCGGCLLWQDFLLVACNLARNEAWTVQRISCSLQWCVEMSSIFKEICVINS